MVDEFQDTNRLQLELIELLARDNLFTVGDAQQSIYAFRHADVELFEQRGERLEQVARGPRCRPTSARAREILDVIDARFASAGRTTSSRWAGRDRRPRRSAVDEPRVELLVADKGADWAIGGRSAARRGGSRRRGCSPPASAS